MSCFLEIHVSEDDGFLLLCLRDTLHKEVVKLKLGLDHLKFKNSKNGAEMVSFGQKLSFIKCFLFFGQFLVNHFISEHFAIFP